MGLNKLDIEKHLIEHEILKTASKAYVDANDFWKRVGAILSPKTAGDDITTTGDIQSKDLTATGNLDVTGTASVTGKTDLNDELKVKVGQFGAQPVQLEFIKESWRAFDFLLMLPNAAYGTNVLGFEGGPYFTQEYTSSTGFKIYNKNGLNYWKFNYADATDKFVLSTNATDNNFYWDDVNLSLDGWAKIGDGGTTNYCEIKADGEINLHGTARVKKEFGVILTDFNPGASGPTKALHDIFPTFEFTINDDMHTSFELPTDWEAGTDIEIEVYWAIDEAYATNNGEVRWNTDWRAVAVGEVISGGASGTIDFGDVRINTTANAIVKTEGTIPGASLAQDDLIAFNGSRVALVAGNNPTAEPYIVAVRVEYTANKLGEAT